MLKYSFLLKLLVVIVFVNGQPVNDLLRGPQNTQDNGVLDGVVIKDEIPVRSKIEYEHVRLADYVWSKRLFSRIDAREKMNYSLFQPYEKFTAEFTDYPLKNRSEITQHKGWIRNQERLSLWTIIQQHLMNGDLTMYLVADTTDFDYKMEDGYSFKYPVKKYTKDPQDSYFSKNDWYRKTIDKRIGIFQDGDIWETIFMGVKSTYQTNPALTTFKAWMNDFKKQDFPPLGVDTSTWRSQIDIDFALDPYLEQSWNEAMVQTLATGIPKDLQTKKKTFYLSSEMITAYNIKEDWFFDKERSMLDKRIISIAPVARYTIDSNFSQRGALVVKEPFKNSLEAATLLGVRIPISANTSLIEKELFWLYFPELRNVMVNYYVYNNQSDAQWMTYDDFFWKRMFSGTIYRATDQFDREIEDYRYGVDALYEAEKIKENMRTWETDLWNY
jgi:hypothetical protein